MILNSIKLYGTDNILHVMLKFLNTEHANIFHQERLYYTRETVNVVHLDVPEQNNLYDLDCIC